MKKILVGVLAILMVFSLAACGGGSSTGGTSGGTGGNSSGGATGGGSDYSEITASRLTVPTTLEPLDVDNPFGTTITYLIFEKLVRFDNESNVWYPAVAKSWEQVDPQTWKFEIDLDKKFHNGDPLTMEDVMFSINRAKDFPRAVDTYNSIESVSYEGSTLTMKFKDAALGTPNKVLAITFIVNKKYIEEGGDDAIYMMPVSTGPYKVTEFTPLVSSTIELFDGYVGELHPSIDKINFVNIAETDARYIAVESGQIQFAGDLTDKQVALAEQNDALAPINHASQSDTCLGFQTEREPFNNKNLRLAMVYALDVDAFAALQSDIPARSMLFIGFDDVYQESDKYPTYDLEKAKALLEAEGYSTSNPLKCELVTMLQHPGLEMYQAALKSIGVDMTISLLEFSAYIAHETSMDYQVLYTGQGNRGNHYLNDLDRFSNDMYGSRNITMYTTPEAQKLIDELRVTTDKTRQSELIKEMNDVLAADVPMAGIFQKIERAVVDKRLTGVEYDGWGRALFLNASFSG